MINTSWCRVMSKAVRLNMTKTLFLRLSHNANSSNRGTGLVESLIITLLIGLSIIVIIKAQHTLAFGTLSTQQRSDANQLALAQIETLHDYQVLNNTAGYTSYDGIASGSKSSTVGNTTYTINWTVNSFTNPTYKVLDVSVSWTDRYGVAQSITVSSEVAGLDPTGSNSMM